MTRGLFSHLSPPEPPMPDTRNDVRKLKRAARNAGWPLRAYVRMALTRPEQGPPSMMRLAGEARRWATRKGLVLR